MFRKNTQQKNLTNDFELELNLNPRILGYTSNKLNANELSKIGVSPEEINTILNQAVSFCLKLSNLTLSQCQILKKHILSTGGNFAVHKQMTSSQAEKSDGIIIGTYTQYMNLIDNLSKEENFQFSEIAQIIRTTIENFNQDNFVIKTPGKELILKKGWPLIMGILNVTPDSFFDGSLYFNREKAVERAIEMAKEGADIIDIGGESTRPGSEPISAEEELKRVIPVIQDLQSKISLPISVDTGKPEVAEKALNYGASILNTSVCQKDEEIAKIAKKYNVPIIIMHIKGTPKTMQLNPYYEDVISEILLHFRKRIRTFETLGVERSKIIIDPGIGFGKRLVDNTTIIKNLFEFCVLGCPVLIGASRKSFIGMITGVQDPKDRLEGTIVSNIIAALKGATIIRVHDVKEIKRAREVLSHLC